MRYVSQEEKTESRLMSGFNCSNNPEEALREMKATQEMWGKTGGRTYKHFIQSFSEKENVTPEKAHEIACKLVQESPLFRGYECFIATHTDRGHSHSHIIACSVSFENGLKIRQSRSQLQELKDLSDRIVLEHGLSICEKGKTYENQEREETTAFSQKTYRTLKAAERGEVRSHVQEIGLAVLTAREKATSREEFVQQLQERGVSCQWTEKRKYITFTDQEQKKVRNSKLSDFYNMDLSKKGLENEFKANLRKQQNRERRRREITKPIPGAEQGTPGKSTAAFIGELAATRRASESKLVGKLKECANRAAFKQTRTSASLAAMMSQEIALAVRNTTEQAIEDREKV
ncbi:MAG: relaxase/mobilization nuclease domain-containing protein [Lachnospiraceae bacterium]|nr:relaxase/mobilization nuclease domain-containing protein [Lachnospiraceae bacterium]